MKAINTHKCEITECNNISAKDKYGNYKRYCSDECKDIGRKLKFTKTYKTKDTDQILAKRKATNLERYGVENVSLDPVIRARLSVTTTATAEIRTQKTKETNLKNHGVESTNSLPAVKEKKKETLMKNYGVDHQLKDPTIAASVAKKNSDNAKERLAKAAETNIERYGYENPSSNNAVKTKRTNTMLERFGVENASQNAEIHEKKMRSDYRSKVFTFPSGKSVLVQGHEPQALSVLLKSYVEDEILVGTGNVPRIKYNGNSGRGSYYFPDIYIPKDNLIIEVKSKWTYNKNIPKHHEKAKATISAGYRFRFMVIEKNGDYYYIDDIS